MKRIIGVVSVALLGLSVAGFATYVFAQTPPAGAPTTPAPTPAPAPVSLPGTPALPTPAEPVLPTPVAPTTPPAPTTPNPLIIPAVPTPTTPTTPVPVPVAPGISDPATPAKPDGTLPLPMPTTPAKPTDLLPIPGSTPTPAAPMPDKSVVTIPGAPAAPMDLKANVPAGNEDGPGVTEGNPSGRQEPAVSLEWIGPPAAKIGQAADYSIVVRNVCNIPVQQVLVRVRLPKDITVAGTEPKAVAEATVLTWAVGTMLPKQERNLQVKLVSTNKG